MSLFVIADLHLSLGSDKPMDVFPGWSNYTQRLEKNWRAVVKESDTVMVAGDISWAMSLEDALADFTFLHSLPGQKLILKGNHDYWWSTKRKMDTWLAENGFNDIHILHNNAFRVGDVAVCGTRGWLYNSETPEDVKIVNREVGRLRTSIAEAKKLGGIPVAFLHYPPVYDSMKCNDILKVLHEQNITKCYFGHIHGTQASKRAAVGEYEGIYMHLISCDYVGFLPVLVE